MKSIIIALLAASFSSIASGFEVYNQTSECIYAKEYFHIFNRYNEHIPSFKSGLCDPLSDRCTGQLDLRVVKHSHASEVQLEEPLCTWEGDVGKSQGYFIISPNPPVKPGEKGWCKIKYVAKHPTKKHRG